MRKFDRKLGYGRLKLGKSWCFMGGSEPAPASSSTTTQQVYSPEETAARNKVQSEAERIYNSTSGSFTSANYPGAAPTPFSSDTVAAQNYLRNFATTQGSTIAGQAGDALKFGLKDVLSPSSNPALQQTIDTTTRKIGETYTDPGGVLSNIRGAFTGNNSGGSGTREGIAGGLAGRSYLNAVGDATGKITSDAYKEGLDTFNKTLAFAPNAYNLMTQPALTQAAVGQQIEGMQQAQATYGANQQSWALNAPWMGLQNYAQIVYGGANPATTTTGTASTGSANKNAGMGMALQGASIGATVGGPWGALIGGAAGLLMGS